MPSQPLLFLKKLREVLFMTIYRSKTIRVKKHQLGKKMQNIDNLTMTKLCWVWRFYQVVTRLNTDQAAPVGWGCRIHRLLLCWGVRLSQRVSWYDTKQSDGEVPVMLELCRTQSTPFYSHCSQVHSGPE